MKNLNENHKETNSHPVEGKRHRERNENHKAICLKEKMEEGETKYTTRNDDNDDDEEEQRKNKMETLQNKAQEVNDSEEGERYKQ